MIEQNMVRILIFIFVKRVGTYVLSFFYDNQLTFLHVHKVALQRSELLRTEFLANICTFDSSMSVFLDEIGFASFISSNLVKIFSLHQRTYKNLSCEFLCFMA